MTGSDVAAEKSGVVRAVDTAPDPEQQRGTAVIEATEPSTGQPNSDDPPDGGLVAWSQVVSAHIATIMCWGYGTGYAVFQLYYTQELGFPAWQASWIGSVMLFLFFIMGLASGRLRDAGYTRECYIIGSAISCFGMFMTSLSTEYYQLLLAQGVCVGIGGGIMFMPAIANVATYFKEKRMLAMSINACGSSTGAIIFPAIVQYLIPKVGFAVCCSS